jgi:hypothetical protein
MERVAAAMLCCVPAMQAVNEQQLMLGGEQ